MDITRAQQIALDDALVAPTNRLTIGKSNLRLSSDLKSKEPTLQVVYDVLKLTPFYKAFQITADVLEIYMQEFWATATVHHHSIRFKMNNKKHIVNLEYFREMLQICLKLPDQQFEEPPFDEEILMFLRELGHSREIKVITDVNVNKLHQPWRSFAAVINKCLSGKSIGYDTLRLSQAQILWGMYHKKNVDYAYLLGEDFIYQVENKNVKRSNEMYYPRFTKVIVNFFMTKDPSIPRRNMVNWHFSRDEPMFTMIKVVSRHEDTHLYGAIFPDELTNEAIKDSKSYREYYAIASGAEPPKRKASVKKKQAGSNKTKTPLTATGKRLKTSTKAAKPAKQKQPAKMSKAKGLTVLSKAALTEAEQMKLATKRSLIQTHNSHASGLGADEGIGGKPGVPDVPTYGSDDEQISWKSSDEENDDEVGMNDDDDDNDDDDNNNNDNGQKYDGQDNEGQDNDNEQTDSDNDGDDFVHPKFSTHNQEKRQDEEDNEEEGSYLRVQTPSHYESTDDEENVPVSMTVEMPPSSSKTIPPPPVSLIQPLQKTPVSTPKIVPSTSLQNFPTFDSVFKFKDKVKALEDDFSEFKQTNQFAAAVSSIPGIVDIKLRDEAQAENADFINKLDDNIKKIIKEQVKAQVKEQITKILPRIEKTINEQLEAEILTRSSNEAKTSHVVAANFSELELKKILKDKMESNKSIHRSDHQKTLYKALVDAYESDKLILDTYGDTVTIKRCRDDQDEDKEPSAGSNRGSRRRRVGKEPKSTSAPKEKTSKSPSKSKEGFKSHHTSTGNNLARKEDTRDSFNELMDTPLYFLVFVMNWLKVDTLTLELLAGPTFELRKGSCQSLVELEYFLEEVYKVTTDQLDWNKPEGQQYPHDLRKPLPLIPNSQGRRVIPFDHFITTTLHILGVTLFQTPCGVLCRLSTTNMHYRESLTGVESISISMDLLSTGNLLVMSTPGTKSLLLQSFRFSNGIITSIWIGSLFVEMMTSCIHSKKAITRCFTHIEDILLLLVQGKLTNLTIEERLALNVSLRMFTRSIVIQRRVEDLQLGVESYQKNLNLTRSDTYISDLKRLPTYSAHPNPKGFIYHNKDKKNKLMRIDELYKFSDGTLNDVRTALDDILKRIRMKYLPQTEIVTHWFTLIVLSALRRFDNENMLSTMSILTDSKEFIKIDMERRSVKVKELQERFIIKAFHDHQIKKGMSMSVQKSQVHKMAKRDYAWLMISRCSRSHSRQAKEQAQDLKSMITTSIHKLMIEAKDYELKTKVKA
ncbi:hypothetical protein Tco_0504922 [Tanacetum coccineum]